MIARQRSTYVHWLVGPYACEVGVRSGDNGHIENLVFLYGLMLPPGYRSSAPPAVSTYIHFPISTLPHL